MLPRFMASTAKPKMRQTNKRFFFGSVFVTCCQGLLSAGEPRRHHPAYGGEDDDGGPTSTDRGDEGDSGECAIADIADQLEASEHGTDGEGEDSKPFDHRANAELGNQAPGRELEERGCDEGQVGLPRDGALRPLWVGGYSGHGYRAPAGEYGTLKYGD